MRYLIVSSIATCSVLVLCVVTALCREPADAGRCRSAAVDGGTRDPVKQEHLEPVLRPVPSRCVIAANLIVDGKWFVFDSAEIEAIKKLLSTARLFVMPEGIDHISFRPCMISIVLWGVVDGKVVALDVVRTTYPVGDFESFSSDDGRYISRGHKEEKLLLQRAIERARKGEVKPVAVEKRLPEQREEEGARKRCQEPFVFSQSV